MRPHDAILILDFGSQYTQLIARRVRECGVYSEILPPATRWDDVARRKPRGIVLSGGPDSVYRPGAPQVDPAILAAGVPVLGICYGLQAMAQALGGRVEPATGKREYGPAQLELRGDAPLMLGLEDRERVWMSHGDHVSRPPDGFQVLGHTANAPFAAIGDPSRGLYGIQFHPEVSHTPHGMVLLRNFCETVCGCRGDWTMARFAEEAIAEIREKVGGGRALCGISGGVDSAVAAALVHRALGDRLVSLFVDNGVLRKNEADDVMTAFAERLHVPVRRVDASARFLDRLRGVEDPEAKRKAIGEVFIRVFEEEARKEEAAGGPIRWLVQGTLYPDVIESSSVAGPSQIIKSHHNVGGLPDEMGLDILEPLRWLFKDEVRRLGRELGIDEAFIRRHPFPGPGLAVRCIGEVTPERLRVLREADALFLEEIQAAGLYDEIQQAFAVLLPVRSVGIMGDERTYENVCALRAVTTQDFMTADWARIPHELLERISNRIVNEVRGINRVVYDLSSKPPATIEWE